MLKEKSLLKTEIKSTEEIDISSTLDKTTFFKVPFSISIKDFSTKLVCLFSLNTLLDSILENSGLITLFEYTEVKDLHFSKGK